MMFYATECGPASGMENGSHGSHSFTGDPQHVLQGKFFYFLSLFIMYSSLTLLFGGFYCMVA